MNKLLKTIKESSAAKPNWFGKLTSKQQNEITEVMRAFVADELPNHVTRSFICSELNKQGIKVSNSVFLRWCKSNEDQWVKRK